jgi:glycosyltransferase involved in cell wall biosynthesis
VNSPAYRDYLIEKKGVTPSKVSLIPNGADPDMFKPEDYGESFRLEMGLSGKFIITYAGAIGLANDIPTLLQAAYRLRDESNLHFLLVGDGKERPRMEEMAEKLGLENVTFVGPKPKSEMPEVLAASNACVAMLLNIPMFKTTYPNKIFDYMAAGRPTILAIDGVIRLVIENSKAGIYVRPGDSCALAEAIVRLRDNSHECKVMGKAARLSIIKKFNRKKQALEFIKLIRSMKTKI